MVGPEEAFVMSSDEEVPTTGETLASDTQLDQLDDAMTDVIMTIAGMLDTLGDRLDVVDARLNKLDGRFDTYEELFAQITMGYQELNTAFEVLCWKLFGGDPEAEADFRAKMEQARSVMLGWLRDSYKYMGKSDEDLASAMGSLLHTDEPVDQRLRRSGDLSGPDDD